MSHRSRTATLLFIALIVVTTSAWPPRSASAGACSTPRVAAGRGRGAAAAPGGRTGGVAGGDRGLAEPSRSARTITGKNGRFELSAPHAGLWNVRVQAPGHVPLEAGLRPLDRAGGAARRQLLRGCRLPAAGQGPAARPASRGFGADAQRTVPIRRGWGSGWSFPVRGGLTGRGRHGSAAARPGGSRSRCRPTPPAMRPGTPRASTEVPHRIGLAPAPSARSRCAPPKARPAAGRSGRDGPSRASVGQDRPAGPLHPSSAPEPTAPRSACWPATAARWRPAWRSRTLRALRNASTLPDRLLHSAGG